MKESNLTPEERAMYGICFITIVSCVFLLGFLGFNTPNSITGFAVYETLDNGIVSEEGIVSSEDLSLENITQKTALDAILQAEKDMEEMQEQGFGVVWFNDTLIEAKKYFEGENYTVLLKEIEKINDTERREKATQLLISAQESIGFEVDYLKVLEKARAINERKQKAYEISDLIRASELSIEEFKQKGLDTSDAGLILANAFSEFENERYEDSENLLESIDSRLIELSAETTLGKTIYRAGKENIAGFLKDHYIGLLLLFGSLLVIAILFYNRIRIAMLRRQIKEMKAEESVLRDLMKKVQSDYFAKADITKQTFEMKMSKYKEKMVEIKRKLPVAEGLLEKRLKSKRVL